MGCYSIELGTKEVEEKVVIVEHRKGIILQSETNYKYHYHSQSHKLNFNQLKDLAEHLNDLVKMYESE